MGLSLNSKNPKYIQGMPDQVITTRVHSDTDIYHSKHVLELVSLAKVRECLASDSLGEIEGHVLEATLILGLERGCCDWTGERLL
jgi:hypothetical protein